MYHITHHHSVLQPILPTICLLFPTSEDLPAPIYVHSSVHPVCWPPKSPLALSFAWSALLIADILRCRRCMCPITVWVPLWHFIWCTCLVVSFLALLQLALANLQLLQHSNSCCIPCPYDHLYTSFTIYNSITANHYMYPDTGYFLAILATFITFVIFQFTFSSHLLMCCLLPSLGLM